MTLAKDMIGGGRPMRPCSGLGIGCGQVDDHPRHVIDTGTDEDVQFHLDCHAAAGCASCAEQIASRPKNATGQKLLDHLLEQAPTVSQHDDTPQED
ncbi:hypothetical protein [Pseudonocardia alni]|uniref:hypothetical protein n=1 Tax=Pseudonocardia alni TaxID=33907 RepID=UPI0027A05159|nr:hypothetical protein PaSha_14025 [Pseudonocardia alni]WFG47494.1 hypothetical protein PaSha_28850 [Pseudonocardia alni]